VSQDYKIAWVGDKTRDWESHGSAKRDYKIALDGVEGTLTLSQLTTSDPPRPGDSLYGHIEEEEVTPRNGDPFTAYKFRKDKRENGHPAIGGSVAQRRGQQTTPGDFDSRSLRIERQHSQEMALRAITLAGGPTKLSEVRSDIQDWTDYFMDDLDAYERARRGITSAPGSGTRDAPVSTPNGEQAQGRDSAPEISEDEAREALADPEDSVPF
jgi:hypothetical protein